MQINIRKDCRAFEHNNELIEFSCYNNSMSIIIGPRCKKNCLLGFADYKGPDQLAHPCSPISTLVIHLLESITSRLAMNGILFF